jgi:Family of unknown function (DUF6252)
MRNVLVLMVLFAISIFSTSCKKNAETDPATGSNTFSFKVDGTKFTPKQILAKKVENLVLLTATDGTQTLILTVLASSKAGDYNMDLGGDYAANFTPTLAGTTAFAAESATSKLTITEHNTTTKHLKGSFNFKGVELIGSASKMITEGVFDVTYQ